MGRRTVVVPIGTDVWIVRSGRNTTHASWDGIRLVCATSARGKTFQRIWWNGVYGGSSWFAVLPSAATKYGPCDCPNVVFGGTKPHPKRFIESHGVAPSVMGGRGTMIRQRGLRR